MATNKGEKLAPNDEGELMPFITKKPSLVSHECFVRYSIHVLIFRVGESYGFRIAFRTQIFYPSVHRINFVVSQTLFLFSSDQIS